MYGSVLEFSIEECGGKHHPGACPPEKYLALVKL